MDSSYGRIQASGPAPVGQGYGALGGAAPLVELALRALGGAPRASYNPPVSEEAASALGAMRRPATGSKPMRDYLGNEVQGAMDVIRALAPPPALPPQAALGAPMQRKGGGMIRGRGDGRSDSVPGVVLGRGRNMDAVAVSDGEYVIPADAVSALGLGSSDAGARKLDRMVEDTRAGYRAHLGRIPEPRKGGKRKGFGGLFESSQDTEIVQPDWARDLGGAGKSILLNVLGPRTPEEGVAGFTPDQEHAFNMSRFIATGDPGNVQAGIARSREDVMGQQTRLGGAQDYLAGVYGQGGWSDKLVDDSLADFDYQREKDVAAAARNRAGRGAFGERRAIAEDEESVASNIARAKLGSSLREQGLNQRMAAASGMGNLARTSGDLANLGAGLATTQRDVQVGNAGLLNQVGSTIQDRNQRVLDDPYRKVDAYRGFMSGAPSTTSTTTQQSPLQTGMGLALMAGGMFLRDGGKVRLGRPTKRGYALGGQVLGASPDKAALIASRMAAGPVLGSGMTNMDMANTSRVMPGMMGGGAALGRMPTPLPGGMGGIRAGDPMPRLPVGGGISAGDPVPRLGAVAPTAPDPMAMRRARLAAINGGRGMPQLPALGSMPMQRSPLLRGFADGGLMGEDGGGLQEVGWLKDSLNNLKDATPWLDPWVAPVREWLRENVLPESMGGIPASPEPPAEGESDGAEFVRPPPPWEEPPLPKETIPDALGMNYRGPDSRMPASLERRYMKARPDAGAVDTGESAPVAAPAKASVADKVKAVLGSGAPKPRARAPMADVERDRSGPIPVPASKPGPRLGAPERPRFANNFMPEMKTGEAHEAPAQAATQGGASKDEKAGGGWNLGDALTNPVTMAGLALLASNSPTLGGAIGEAGLAAAKTVSERKRQEKEDARQAKQDAWTERRVGVDERQLEATLGNQKLLAEGRAADDRRADETLGLRRQEIEDNRNYKNARLGQMGQGLAIQRQNADRLLKGLGKGAAAKMDPLNRVLMEKYAGQLAEAEANGDTEAADAIRQRLFAIGALGGGDAVGSLPAGAELNEE